ncbi:MAG TPA: TRAP transporter large permease [Syntrophorhabdaceae bacterium]|nr:TRAP transporter large permease [Syntrophorhabdaceae bacterium]
MSEATLIGIIGLIALLVLFSTGIELAFAMSVIGMLGIVCLRSVGAAITVLGKDYFDVFSSYSFTVIPLFVLMGQIALNSGMAEQMYKMSRRFVGHVPGGLAFATVVGATLFKAISGSTLATAATFSGIAVPEMDKYRYGRLLSTGVVASVGTLGTLLPPSNALIIMGMITEQSIGKLFLAGMIPGLMCAALFLGTIYVWCKMDPSLGPKGPVYPWKERLRSVPQVVWPLLIFLLVIGGLLAGFFTPTEAGSVGTIGVCILTVLRKDITFKAFMKSLRESVLMGCVILMLIASSNVLGHFITMAKIPYIVAEWTAALPLNRYVIVCLICIIYLIGGSFIDDAAFMILATPIFFPAAIKLGFDPIWFVIVLSVTCMIGIIIPPIAMSVFIVKSITKESIWVVYKGVTPFIISLVVMIGLLFVFPGIATWLPNALMK